MVPAIDIVLPDPCLVVLVGPAGAGKSTLAARHFLPSEVLASDAFRAHVGESEADQTATRPAFSALHAAVARRLARGQLTVVDATNVQRHARQSLVRRARLAGVAAIAIVLDVSEEICLAGDQARPGRHVDPFVIHRQWLDLQDSLGRQTTGPRGRSNGLLDEGFSAVHLFADRATVDALKVRRDRIG